VLFRSKVGTLASFIGKQFGEHPQTVYTLFLQSKSYITNELILVDFEQPHFISVDILQHLMKECNWDYAQSKDVFVKVTDYLCISRYRMRSQTLGLQSPHPQGRQRGGSGSGNRFMNDNEPQSDSGLPETEQKRGKYYRTAAEEASDSKVISKLEVKYNTKKLHINHSEMKYLYVMRYRRDLQKIERHLKLAKVSKLGRFISKQFGGRAMQVYNDYIDQPQFNNRDRKLVLDKMFLILQAVSDKCGWDGETRERCYVKVTDYLCIPRHKSKLS
jgi:hypothetical protein